MTDSRIKRVTFKEVIQGGLEGESITVLSVELADGTAFDLPTAGNKATLLACGGVHVWQADPVYDDYGERVPSPLFSTLDESWRMPGAPYGLPTDQHLYSPLLAGIMFRLTLEPVEPGGVLHDENGGITNGHWLNRSIYSSIRDMLEDLGDDYRFDKAKR